MRKGDECFFYHSVSERAIKGIVRVTKEYYPDPTDPKGRFWNGRCCLCEEFT